MSYHLIGGEHRIDSSVLIKQKSNTISPSYSLGRTCFYCILDSLGRDRTVLIPDYICISVAAVPYSLGMKLGNYHILQDFTPDMESLDKCIDEGNEIVLLVSYFGLVDLDDVIRYLRTNHPDVTIIVDDVQNYYDFGKHIDYDYCFSSNRKWFAVPDGADILSKQDTLLDKSRFNLDSNPEYIKYKVAGNLLKNHTDIVSDSVALELIDKGEELMDEDFKYSCSDMGRELMQRTDVDSVQSIRKSNALILHRGLEELGINHVFDTTKTPLFIPIMLDGRDDLRRQLFSKEIFTPIHWPVVDTSIQGNNDLYKKELSMIIDQRYDEEDMQRIIQEIKNAI